MSVSSNKTSKDAKAADGKPSSITSTAKYIAVGLGVGAAVGYLASLLYREYTSRRSEPDEEKSSDEPEQDTLYKIPVQIYFCSAKVSNKHPKLKGGSSRKVAGLLAAELKKLGVRVQLRDMSEPAQSDPEDLNKYSVAAFVVPTYDGKMPESARFFEQWIEEAANDHRVPDGYLAHLRYVVLGLGDLNYGQELYCTAAKSLHETLQGQKFRAKSLLDRICEIDEPSTDLQVAVTRFLKFAKPKLKQAVKHKKYGLFTRPKKKTAADLPDPHSGKGMDMEDLGIATAVTADTPKPPVPSGPKEMLNEKTRKALTKVGYKLVGSHSGVKICRWTKASMRGRGGCYKHTFYNITSHRCMEMTPSMACANKCVFCWRQHLNPVATEWKWLMDEPGFILDGAIAAHRQALKCVTPKGCPGVTEQRYQEAMQPQHCALSLVGEPIMYPKINELAHMMHQRGISTFMVTNAQFPDALRKLIPVTQLYLSVDAATRDSLKKIDRPLNKDFWERFIECIDLLRIKPQRTVFRMTMVKKYNMEDTADYARLIARGQPSFVEIKAVTYTGHDQPIDFVNIPFLVELEHYAEKLCSYVSDDYELACVHKHSLCALLAHKKFKIGDKNATGKDARWRTWIDYDKFYELTAEGDKFTDLEYALETPQWALWGAEEGGFDPNHKRHFRKQKPNQTRRNAAHAKAETEVKEDREQWLSTNPEELRSAYADAKRKYNPDRPFEGVDDAPAVTI